jgi:cytochrome c-type biogenesis protein CcmF
MLWSEISSYSFYIAFFLNIIYYCALFFTPESKKSISIFIFGLSINSLIIICFIFFILSFVYSDFSLYSVFANSHTSKPLIYKIGAAWSSHEGSMLFWLFIMAIYSLFHTIKNRKNDQLSLHFQSFIQLILHGFILITSNPFQKLYPIPIEGNGFNPLLQDYSLLIHPPILYLGYAGSSICFAKILSLAVHNSYEEKSWRAIRPWVTIPFFFLTFGIALGSLWSYRELGWGGFWAWDPVENVSLLSWFASLSFIHLLLIRNKTYLIHYLLKLNGILIFIFSLFSTFIVRSGLISSIHAFAKNNENNWYFLILLGFFALFGLFIIIKYDQSNANQKSLSKNDKILFFGINLFSICYLIIICTILFPIYLNVHHSEIVNVSETFYQKIFGIIFIPILLLISYLPIKKPFLNKKNVLIFCLSVIFSFIFIDFRQISTLTTINLILSITIFTSYLINFFYEIFDKKRINFASFFSHIGIAIMIFGAIFSTINSYSSEKMMNIDKEKIIQIGDYSAILKSVNIVNSPDFTGIKGNFDLWHKNFEIGKSNPELKFYKIEKMQLPDSSSFYHRFSDIYLLITGVDKEKNMIYVKIFFKKFVMLIWIGLFLMILGGFLSIFSKNN